MIKYVLLLWPFLAAAVSAPPEKTTLASFNSLRVFYRLRPVTLSLHIDHRYGQESYPIERYFLGVKTKVTDFLWWDLYTGVRKGVKQENDWVTINGKWVWQDPRVRTEEMVQTGPTLKIIWPDPLVTHLRVLWSQNLYDNRSTLLVRLGTSYLQFGKTGPSGLFMMFNETHFPLNFSENTIFKNYTYFNYMYYFNYFVQMGPVAGLCLHRYSTSQLAKDKGSSYNSLESTYFIGMNIRLAI